MNSSDLFLKVRDDPEPVIKSDLSFFVLCQPTLKSKSDHNLKSWVTLNLLIDQTYTLKSGETLSP